MFPKFKTFLANLKNNKPAAKSLYWYSSDEECLQIIDALKHNTVVTTINHFPSANPHLVRAFADTLKVNQSLKFIKDLPFDDEETFLYFMQQIQSNKTIKELRIELHSFVLDTNTMDLVNSFILNNQALTYFIMIYMGQIDETLIKILIHDLDKAHLKTLFLSQMSLTPGATHLLGKHFSSSKTLNNLVLYNCHIHDQELIDLEKAFSQIKRKKILVLLKNPLTEKGLNVLAKGVIASEKLFVHFYQKKENGSLMRFETTYIEPHLKRDWKKELKSFAYLV